PSSVLSLQVPASSRRRLEPLPRPATTQHDRLPHPPPLPRPTSAFAPLLRQAAPALPSPGPPDDLLNRSASGSRVMPPTAFIPFQPILAASPESMAAPDLAQGASLQQRVAETGTQAAGEVGRHTSGAAGRHDGYASEQHGGPSERQSSGGIRAQYHDTTLSSFAAPPGFPADADGAYGVMGGGDEMEGGLDPAGGFEQRTGSDLHWSLDGGMLGRHNSGGVARQGSSGVGRQGSGGIRAQYHQSNISAFAAPPGFQADPALPSRSPSGRLLYSIPSLAPLRPDGPMYSGTSPTSPPSAFPPSFVPTQSPARLSSSASCFTVQELQNEGACPYYIGSGPGPPPPAGFRASTSAACDVAHKL
ncbi:hypothetical protein CYMTET_34852, partial [Cymbomonas tetramitiformis]